MAMTGKFVSIQDAMDFLWIGRAMFLTRPGRPSDVVARAVSPFPMAWRLPPHDMFDKAICLVDSRGRKTAVDFGCCFCGVVLCTKRATRKPDDI
jgi:hypothetical protein